MSTLGGENLFFKIHRNNKINNQKIKSTLTMNETKEMSTKHQKIKKKKNGTPRNCCRDS
jgi:hypothetical protein